MYIIHESSMVSLNNVVHYLWIILDFPWIILITVYMETVYNSSNSTRNLNKNGKKSKVVVSQAYHL